MISRIWNFFTSITDWEPWDRWNRGHTDFITMSDFKVHYYNTYFFFRDVVLEDCDYLFKDGVNKVHDRQTLWAILKFRKLNFVDTINYFPYEKQKFERCTKNLDEFLRIDRAKNGDVYPAKCYLDTIEQFEFLFNPLTVILIFFCLGVIVGILTRFFPASHSVRQFNALFGFGGFFSSLISSLKYFSKTSGFMLMYFSLIVFFSGAGLFFPDTYFYIINYCTFCAPAVSAF